MKRHLLVLVAIAVFATALTTTASGQTAKTVRANVKFDFRIGDRFYPAGEYRIESISWHSDVLRIGRISDANKSEFILANPSNAGRSQTPRLVFEKYGEDYFLTKLFLDTQQWGYSIRSSHRQLRSEKTLASNLPSKPVKVVTLVKAGH